MYANAFINGREQERRDSLEIGRRPKEQLDNARMSESRGLSWRHVGQRR
ncbi:hypothetical protein MY11210_005301 [Beauveria gryllotalpidicola]